MNIRSRESESTMESYEIRKARNFSQAINNGKDLGRENASVFESLPALRNAKYSALFSKINSRKDGPRRFRNGKLVKMP